MKKKGSILFAGFEFREKVQRGIYLYGKSLIRATKKNGYRTGILTATKGTNNPVSGLTSIFQSLQDPDEHRLSRKKLLHKYALLRAFGILDADHIPNTRDILSEEALWFLNEVDAFLDVPAIYELIGLKNRLNFEKPLDISFSEKYGYDTVFTTSPLFIESRSRKQKIIQTIHDLIPVKVAMQREDPLAFYRRLEPIERRADKVLAVSNYSRDQFLKIFPSAADRVKVVYQPLPADKQTLHLSSLPLVQKSVLQKFSVKEGGYCMFIGATEARKNVHRAIAAHAMADTQEEFPFLIAGPVHMEYLSKVGLAQHFGEPQLEPKKRRGQSTKFRYIGYITELEKLCLLRNARLFIFPTLNEGFGIPVLEAQALGCPVVTSRNSSLPEVVADSAVTVEDAFNIEEIAHAIGQILHDTEQYHTYRRLGLENATRFNEDKFAADIDALLSE